MNQAPEFPSAPNIQTPEIHRSPIKDAVGKGVKALLYLAAPSTVRFHQRLQKSQENIAPLDKVKAYASNIVFDTALKSLAGLAIYSNMRLGASLGENLPAILAGLGAEGLNIGGGEMISKDTIDISESRAKASQQTNQ